MLYALKAPLTINWGSQYSPQAGGGNMASMVMPESGYTTIPWNGNDQPVNSFLSNWQASSNNKFVSFDQGSMANAVMENANGLQWERKLYSLVTNSDLPVIMIKDNFSGSNFRQGKVMTINLMATGAVSTPVGSITPPVRLSPDTQIATVLPSVSPTITLNPVANHFIFTGQSWMQHPTRGIDWDLYTIADEPQQAVIGNWGHSWIRRPRGHSFKVPTCKTFSESQHILRVQGNDSFWTLILPYYKGKRPSNLTVAYDAATTGNCHHPPK